MKNSSIPDWFLELVVVIRLLAAIYFIAVASYMIGKEEGRQVRETSHQVR